MKRWYGISGLMTGLLLMSAATVPAHPQESSESDVPRALLPGDGGDSEPPRCVDGTTIGVAVNPPTVQLGQSSVVTWHVQLPSGCGGVVVKLNGIAVGSSGSRVVTPPRKTVFTVTISQSGASASRSAAVQVLYPSPVVINAATADPVKVMVGALVESVNPVQQVQLCGVDLDLTGYSQIVLGANRSLTAQPGCACGPRSLGPRIFVTDKRNEKNALFVIRDSNVRISGFRLEGPTSGIGSEDNNRENGIQVLPFAVPGPLHDIEISNMELFHWSGAAIGVDDTQDIEERGRLTNTNVNAVTIRNNFIHHNRHYDGYGYGVVVGHGAYALIEQNVFDENRHAIAGGSRPKLGKDYSGYTARDNLILAGGGQHCTSLGICWHTHQIDMHGDQSTLFGGDWCCGTAGETIIIQRNTILYTAGYAIKIRGNPADKAVVDGDVFRHHSRGDAIAQNGDPGWGDNITNPIDVRPNNVFGSDPTTQLGACDFAGDGRPDQFMATGVTWWAKSPVTLQWRYLNTMRERLPDIVLGKFDGNAVCDVALRPLNPIGQPVTYSKSGTGPWVPFGASSASSSF